MLRISLLLWLEILLRDSTQIEMLAVNQQIWLLRQVARIRPQSATLHDSDYTIVDEALHRLRYGWEQNKESSMDPINQNGPLSFTSTALLRVAYVQIAVSGRLTPRLTVWNPKRIASMLSQLPPVQRIDRTMRAALHCAHALSISVRRGIDFVAHTLAFFWSNQHALRALESAILLSKWLEAVTVPNPQPPLADGEAQLLSFINQIVAETHYSGLGERDRNLNSVVIRLWAKLFRAERAWEMVNLVGESMETYADILESKHVTAAAMPSSNE